MKKIVPFALLFVFGCKSSSSDIKISQLKDPCDVLSAFEIVADEIQQFKKEEKEVYEFVYTPKSDTSRSGSEESKQFQKYMDDFKFNNKDKIEKIEMLNGKLKDLEMKADKSFTLNEFKECPNFEAVKKKLLQIQ